MTTIFYGYGFGLFGHVDRWTLSLVCAGMWAVMLLWSKPWLDRFLYGPLEWLWRSLARGKPQPMRQCLTARPKLVRRRWPSGFDSRSSPLSDSTSEKNTSEL